MARLCQAALWRCILGLAVLAAIVDCAHATARWPSVWRLAAAAKGWSYDVVAAPGGEMLDVQATFPAGSGATFSVGYRAEGFVRDLLARSLDGDQNTRATPTPEGNWSIPACGKGCRVSYRFELAKEARASNDRDLAVSGAVQSPPSKWLLRPLEYPHGTTFRLHVTAAPGESFATGLLCAVDAPDDYAASAPESFNLPYYAFGRLRSLPISARWVEAVLLPGEVRDERAIANWIDRSAQAIERFYGRPPASRVLVIISPEPGSGTGFGTTMGSGGASILISVGSESAAESLRNDWVLPHEMVHTALPGLPRQYHWLEEGLATYVGE